MKALVRVKAVREEVSRWYWFSPAPHMTCPKCGGFVRSTLENSPWLAILLVFLVVGGVSSFMWPDVRYFANSTLGRFGGVLVVVLLTWVAVKNSRLVHEQPRR